MKLFLLVCAVLVVRVSSLERSRRQPICGDQDYLTENNGEIISHTGFNNGHNYGKNLDCVWKIEAPEGLNVQLTAVTFDLESDASCYYDYLELFDGSDPSAPSLGKFCGDKFQSISSTQRFLTLQFKTDSSTQRNGFKIFYNFTNEVVRSCLASQFQCDNGKCIDRGYHCDSEDDCGDDSDEIDCTGIDHGGRCDSDEFLCPGTAICINTSWLCDGDDDCGDGSDETPVHCSFADNSANCGETNITGTEGSISSPGWPQNYTSDTRCLYIIKAPAGTQEITFKFDEEFGLEPDVGCSYDFINIAGDLSLNVNRYGPFCGEDSPGAVTIAGDHAYFLFNSDSSINYAGFIADWFVN